MNVLEINYVKKVGLRRDGENNLNLKFEEENLNHLGTLHASALNLLAETASGEFLEIHFPQYASKVLPILRSATLNYKKPATQDVYATASITPQNEEKFIQLFSKKNRASIDVEVLLKDYAGTLCAKGTFNWFIQGI